MPVGGFFKNERDLTANIFLTLHSAEIVRHFLMAFISRKYDVFRSLKYRSLTRQPFLIEESDI
jgi:hypothetical protein